MEWLASPELWVAFLTLTAPEIVLGIDNIIFISILVSRLPKHQQPKARFFGLALAMGTRILLLLSISWVMRLTADLFHVFDQGFSGRDLILLFGGLFLLWKSTAEIFHSLEGEEEVQAAGGKAYGFMGIIVQIATIDISVIVMMLSAGTISDFIDKHPSLKILALSFLIVVGTVLVAEAFGVHVPKGYVYFAMAFSLAVEAVNIRMRVARARARKEAEPESVQLRKDLPD